MPRALDELIDSEDILAEELKDPEFRAEWERTAVARAVSMVVLTNRVRKGLTQTALARAAGVSQPAIARVESGEHVPTVETLIKIANALDIEIMVGISPSSRAEPTIAKRPSGAKTVEEVTASLGSRLVVASS